MKTIISVCVVALMSLSFIAEAGWQCNVRNARNQLWVGTGPTPAAARFNAFKFCSNNSINPATCRLMRCFPI